IVEFEAQIVVQNVQSDVLEQVAQILAPQTQTTNPAAPVAPLLQQPQQIPGLPALQQSLAEFFSGNVTAQNLTNFHMQITDSSLPKIFLNPSPIGGGAGVGDYGGELISNLNPSPLLPSLWEGEFAGKIPEGSSLLTTPVTTPEQISPRIFENIKL